MSETESTHGERRDADLKRRLRAKKEEISGKIVGLERTLDQLTADFLGPEKATLTRSGITLKDIGNGRHWQVRKGDLTLGYEYEEGDDEDDPQGPGFCIHEGGGKFFLDYEDASEAPPPEVLGRAEALLKEAREVFEAAIVSPEQIVEIMGERISVDAALDAALDEGGPCFQASAVLDYRRDPEHLQKDGEIKITVLYKEEQENDARPEAGTVLVTVELSSDTSDTPEATQPFTPTPREQTFTGSLRAIGFSIRSLETAASGTSSIVFENKLGKVGKRELEEALSDLDSCLVEVLQIDGDGDENEIVERDEEEDEEDGGALESLHGDEDDGLRLGGSPEELGGEGGHE